MLSRTAILGGGVLGLTTALRLLQDGQQVTVFEREDLPGGLAAGFPVSQPQNDPDQTIWLEKFYHHIFRSDTTLIRLVNELGMEQDLQWLRPETVTLLQGHTHQLDSALSLLRFQPIPMASRMRMGLGLAYLRALSSADSLEGKTAAQWIRRVMGKAAYDAVWGPLLRGKFGAVADEIALSWFWARVHDRTPQLGYIRGGFQRFYNRLAQRVQELGGQLHFQTYVQKVHTVPAGLQVTFTNVKAPEQVREMVCSRVVSTLPIRLTCRITPELDETDYRARHDVVRAYGAHCLILALNRQLTDSYWMNVNDPGYPFMVLVEHTNMMPPGDYGNRHLIYLGNYRAMNDPLFAMDKDAVTSAYLPHLQRINADFDPSWVQQTWMYSAQFAQPIVDVAYRQAIPPFTTPLAGFYVANMFQVYPHDRGQNYSVELAEKFVKFLQRQRKI